MRQAAAVAYGALSAVFCSVPISSNGRQNHVLLGSLVDRFIGWALPLLNNVISSDGTMELALDSLREFLNVGDVGGIERYALPILKACQVLLEDERTSLNLLHRILGVLTLISLKFYRSFQPHFLDIVDLLLGWALVPDLADSDRRIIMDGFLQFQKHWVGNLQFSTGLLSKFLGDMDVLLQDGSPGTPQQFQRWLALLSCFLSVLQSTASGLLEINLLEQIIEPLGRMVPRLLGCLSMVGRKFGWLEWIRDLWKCLTLLAEILGERFSTFYPHTVDILFQILENGAGKITSFQIHGVLKTNLQLLSLQKFGLLPSAVQKMLQFDAPVSQLRLHPNHVVTGSVAATYIFLLQHGNDEVVQHAVTSLIEELELLKGMVEKKLLHGYTLGGSDYSKCISRHELFALFKFDLKVLLTCVSLDGDSNLLDQCDVAAFCLKRSENLVSFIIEKLNPFESPFDAYAELQVNIVKMLDRLSVVELMRKSSVSNDNVGQSFVDVTAEKLLNDSFGNGHSSVIVEHLRKYSVLFIKGLQVSSLLAVKLACLGWVKQFCENVISIRGSLKKQTSFYEAYAYIEIIRDLIHAVLDAALDREPKVRSHVPVLLELLLQGGLVHPVYFYPIAEVVLEKLGDPDDEIKNAFTRLLANVLPTVMYACGLHDCGTSPSFESVVPRLGYYSSLHWKQVFALKQLHKRLHAQQLVSILSYISQRWKVPLSSWIQRLIHSCRRKDFISSQSEETGNFGGNDVWLNDKVDEDVLEKNCSVNILAGAWWAINEAARYCISTRLRTNLGGPTQTFAALERMLLDLALLLQLDSEQLDGNLSMIGASGAHLLPMRLLLDFVEVLKKNVYNAYEGSAVLPSANRASSSFFRANKKVCEEWFSRICEPMMKAGLALQCHDATIQYCTLRLQELRILVASSLRDKSRVHRIDNYHNIRGRFSAEILRVLRSMALALSKSHEPEALIGLGKWASMTFSFLFGEENQCPDTNGILGPLSWITGLVYQAGGQYEKATAHFIHLLQSEESLCSMGSDGVQFSIARIIESYAAVCDWKSLESWLLELQALRAKHAGKSYSGALTTAGNEINAIHALARYDEGDFQAAWGCLDLTPKSSSELTLDPKLALQRSEQMLLQAMLLQNEGKEEKVPHELQKAKSMLEETLSILPFDGLVGAASYATQLHCIFVFEESYKLLGSQEKSGLLSSGLSSYVQSLQVPMSIISHDCNPWLKVLRVYKTISPTSQVTLKFCINLLRLARKKRNLMLASRLNIFLKDHTLTFPKEGCHDFLISYLHLEDIMLMHAENKFEAAFTNLWSFVRSCMVSSASIVSDAEENFLKAKACLKLSSWLKQNCSALRLDIIVPMMLSDFGATNSVTFDRDGPSLGDENSSCKTSLGPVIEEIVGTATKLSTRLCPAMGKTWISYASWCFDQARHYLLHPDKNVYECSFSPILSKLIPGRSKLTEDEIMRIESLILQLYQNKNKNDSEVSIDEQVQRSFLFEYEEHSRSDNSMNAIMHQVVNILEAMAGAPGAENFSGESLSATLASQLQKSFLLTNFGLNESDVSSIVNQLAVIWWSLRKRRVALFGHAAHGFIQYLLYSSAMVCNGGLAGFKNESLKQKTGSNSLKATLYVLHILLNYGAELKDTLEPALSTVPLSPWQVSLYYLYSLVCFCLITSAVNKTAFLLQSSFVGSNTSVVCPAFFSSRESGSVSVGGLTNDVGQAISVIHCLPNTS